MHFLDSLSPQQREAVLFTDGAQLIVAGAGAGKTKTITARIAHIIEKGTSPEKILAVTFTNKAAKEMRERVNALLGEMRKHTSPVVLTFHALGVSILREHGVHLGLPKSFSILDEDDSLSLIKECFKILDISTKEFEPKFFRSIISTQRQKGVEEKTYIAESHGIKGTFIKNLWRLYDEKKRESHAVDFDDLISLPIHILKTFPEVKQSYNNRFDYIHVDEYQDVNDLQVEMIELILGKHNNICVVGDADQTIYSWRGSKIEHIMQFEKKFAPCHIVLLEENYRSTKTILDFANVVVTKNKNRIPKNLYTNQDGGEIVSVLECVDEVDEARMIIKHVQEELQKGKNPKDIAILYRANFQSRVLEEAFVQNSIPYIMLGTKFFDRKEIKDVLSYIRVAMNTKALVFLTRAISTPSRGIGKTTLAKIISGDLGSLNPAVSIKVKNFYNMLEKISIKLKTEKLSTAIVYIIRESGLEQFFKDEGQSGVERLENIKELVSLATNYDIYGDDSLDLFLEHISLYESDVVNQNKTDGVSLMTVHSAKGLEWKTVFVVGLEQGLFPHTEGFAKTEEQEEERRLMYVALTRAREKLFLSYAQLRTIFGQKKVQMPSEFLYDIPEEAKEIIQSWNNGKERVVYLD